MPAYTLNPAPEMNVVEYSAANSAKSPKCALPEPLLTAKAAAAANQTNLGCRGQVSGDGLGFWACQHEQPLLYFLKRSGDSSSNAEAPLGCIHTQLPQPQFQHTQGRV